MTSTKLKPVDVVVVGMGVAGTIVCKELAQAGLRVVGLERGAMMDQNDFAMPYAHDELKYSPRNSPLLQDLSRDTITFRNSLDETALPMREVGAFKNGECVGGGGVHWGGVSMRFLPWDFETRSRTIERYGREQIPSGCTSQDWGITYDELEPYYDQFEHLYGVCGKAGNLNGEIQPGGNPFEGARSREFPNPPWPTNCMASLFANAAESLGYKPYGKPTATMTRPYINPYRLALGQCVNGGFCAGFGCAMGAKATPLTTVVPALLRHENFELRTGACVVKIKLDSAKQRAVAVTYVDARGREIEQPADIVVLAAYVFSNSRLMLLSGIGKPYDPVTNTGAVGKNYSFQASSYVRLFFEDKAFNRFMGNGALGIAIDEFNGDNFDHAGLDFFGGAFIGFTTHGAAPIRSHPVPPGTPHWGVRWKRAIAQYYDRSIAIGVHGGNQSYRTCYFDLDPTFRDVHGLPLLRMTFDWQDNEKKMSRFIIAKAAEIGKAMGPSQMSVDPLSGRFSIVPYQSPHNIGGAIMGADPSTSAVNRYLQAWDVPNVFVIGGSAFPQNSANNPTATIGALACWASDAIKERYLKRPELMT